jgi:proline iminopeptidase
MKKNVFLLLFLSYSIVSFTQEQYIMTSDSVKLYVKVQGKGTPCLYLHGGPAAGSYFLDTLFGGYLEQHFKMIYLDQRGSGRSTSPKDNNYSMDRMIKDFEEVRKSLGIVNWITLGHSFGGLLQMGYVQKYSNVINGMIMINCTLNIPESFNESWFPKACEFLQITNTGYYLNQDITIKTRLDSILSLLIKKDLIWKMSFSSKNDNEEMNTIFNNTPKFNNDFFNYGLTLSDYLIDYKEVTKNIDKPILFFYGKKDWCVGPEHYKGVHFPNMILWSFEGEHMMPFLKNKPDLEKAIDRFIYSYKF